jgi:hypothetical protein
MEEEDWLIMCRYDTGLDERCCVRHSNSGKRDTCSKHPFGFPYRSIAFFLNSKDESARAKFHHNYTWHAQLVSHGLAKLNSSRSMP